MKRVRGFLFVVLLVSAVSCPAAIIPKNVVSDAEAIVQYPSIASGFVLMGKSNDDPTLEFEYSERMYAPGMADYHGPADYLVAYFWAGGTANIGTKAASTAQALIDGEVFTMYFPEFTFVNSVAMISFFVAEDGSTYYARDDHQPQIEGGRVGDLVNNTINMTPAEIYTSAHRAAVPEPLTGALLGIGGALLLARRRTR